MKKYYILSLLCSILIGISYNFSFAQGRAVKSESNTAAKSLVEGELAAYIFSGNANDVSGNGNNGTVDGQTLTQDRFGRAQQAYQFSSANGGIQTPSVEQPDAISLWFQSTTENSNLLSWGFGTEGVYGFDVKVIGSAIELVYNSGDGVSDGNTFISLPITGLLDGNWHHLVIDIDQTQGLFTFYVDNENIGTREISSNGILWSGINSSGLEIGPFFTGKMDDIFLYFGKIFPAEVNRFYHREGWAIPDNSLVVNYDFSDGIIGDLSGFGFNSISVAASSVPDRYGVTSNAIGFNGVDQFSETVGVPIYENISTSAWFKTTADFSGGYRSFVDLFGLSALSIGSGNTLEGTLRFGDTDFLVLNSEVTVTDGLWHHAVITYDGTTAALYLDNNLVASSGDRSGPLFQNALTTFLNIGFIFEPGNLRYFEGDVDDINYYNYGIPSSAVNELYSENNWPNAAPVASYPFSNGNANDVSGNGLNGTVNGANSIEDRFQNANAAYSFDGSSYISVSDDPLFSLGQTTDLAVSGWFNTTASSGVLFDKSNGNSGYLAYIPDDGSNQLLFFAVQSGIGNVQLRSSAGYNDGEWHHFVMQMDRDGGMQIYIDGLLDAENTTALSDGFNPDTTEDFLIGVAGATGNTALNTFFNGSLDDFQVFNQLLSNNEIKALYGDGAWPVLGQVQINVNQAAENDPLQAYFPNGITEYGNAYEFGEDQIQFILNGQSDRPYGDSDNDGFIDLLGTAITPSPGLNFVKLFDQSRAYEVAPITSMGFLGSARTGDETGWDEPDTDMEYVGGGVFELNGIELFEGEWKIRANDQWNFANWGSTSGDNGQLSLFAGNIPVSAGFYDISVDVINRTYMVTAASEDTNLRASYSFENNYEDVSGNGNDGSGVNTTFGNDRFGTSTSAAVFNGTDAYVSAPDTEALNFGTTEDIVISGWFRTTNGGVLFDKSDGGDNGFFAQVLETGELYFYMVETSSSTNTADVTTGKTYNDGEWHHYVIQIMRSTSMEIWVDGEADAINEIATDFINPDMAEDFLIGVAGGVDNANLSFFFDGAQDDIKIFNQALSLQEILDLYSVGGWPIVPIPRITSMNPRKAKIGEQIKIFGNNFASNNEANIVSFNGIRANVVSSSNTELVVEVPFGASFGPVYVSADGLVTQSASNFSVIFDGNGLPFDSASFQFDGEVAGNYGLDQASLASADFDQDGVLDVAVISAGTEFSILRNLSTTNGEINFDTPINISVSGETRNITTVDFNGDGKIDVAVTHSNRISIFRNVSSGSGNISFEIAFELLLNGDLLTDIETADMNGDGKLDIVVIERFQELGELSSVTTYAVTTVGNLILNNVANFAVVARNTVGDRAAAINLGDFNGDRKTDIALAYAQNVNSAVLLNTGNFQDNTFGFSQPFDFQSGNVEVEITSGDYDNDNKLDLAMVDDSGDQIINVHTNSTTNPQSGSVSFLSPLKLNSNPVPTSIKTTDFDGDGRLDLVSAIGFGSGVSINRNKTTQTGNVQFDSRVDYFGLGGSVDIIARDFNNDGKADIIGSNGNLMVLRNMLQSADEISVPQSQASNLTFSEITSNGFTVNFNAATNHSGNYLVIRNNSAAPTFIPTDGINYVTGDILGEDRIAYVGPETSFIDSLLNQNTRYFYRIYAFNGSGTISRYVKSNPLTGDETTLSLEGLSSEPTDQPTNFNISNFDEATKSFQVNYSAPATSVDGYLVVRNLNNLPKFIPLDGRSYSLGDVNNKDSIVHVGPDTQFIEQNILSDNEYQYLVFSYNGTEGTINYMQEDPLEGTFNVPATQPSLQPTNFVVNSVGPNAANFSFTAGETVSGYLVLRSEVQIPSNVPEDFVNYQYGDQVNDDVVIYSGLLNSVIDNNLNPSTQYFYAVFAYNGSGDLINYLSTSPLTGQLTTQELPNLAAAPETQPSDFEIISKSENSAEITFSESDASGYLIIRSQSANSFFSPADGITYSLNSRIGNAFITYIGAENTWTEEGLMPFTNYNYKVFAFNGTGDEINYLQASPLQGELLTLTTSPNSQATDFSIDEQDFTSFTVSFAADFDAAEGYLVVRKLGDAAPSSVPVDGVSYSLGVELAEGEEIVGIGLNTEIEESNLTSGDTISYAIYSFNGAEDYINYNTVDPLLGTASTLSDNSAPSISNILFDDEVELGEPVSVTVNVADNESGVQEVEIQYIIPGDNNFDNPSIEVMEGTGTEYSYEIPNLTKAGLEFRIYSKNGVELEQISPIQSVTVVYSNEGLTIPYSSFGTEETNYRIVSIPLTLSSNTINDVFGAELGEYGDLSKWRMFRYSNEVTSELNGSTGLIPGRGYWLIANGSEVTFRTGAGKNVTASVDDPYEIVLTPGWNQIGNPYPYDVSWADIQDFNDENFELRIFNGSFSNGTTLSAFSGGFVNWPNSSDFTLRIPRSTPTSSQNRKSKEEGYGWDMDLILENDKVKNELTGFGMHENAKDELDSRDQFNLPRFLSYIDLNHPIQANGYHIAKNIVEIHDQYNWTFDIESDLDLSKTNLKWEIPQSSAFNKNAELFLWDPSATNLINMKKSSQYQLRNSNGKGLKVIYGSMDYINSLIEISSFHVSDPFPNPSNGVLNFNYFVPESQSNSTIVMEVYNLKGSLVNRKTIGAKDSGVQGVNWDVSSNAEEQLKGVYLLKISNGKHSFNKKIIVN